MAQRVTVRKLLELSECAFANIVRDQR